MPRDETPLKPGLQLDLSTIAYADLYPSLRGRLKAIQDSDDPAIKAKLDRMAALNQRRAGVREAALGERYRLTPAESRLAAHIGEGGSIADYAALHGITVGTARTHLKAVFAKTGAHRQSDLVRLLAIGVR